MCLIKLFRKLYNPEAAKAAPDIDEVEPELAFDAIVRDLGYHTPSRGHKIFSYCFKTGEILEVTPERIEAKGPKGEKIFKKNIKYEPGLLYTSALNMKCAKEHVKAGKFIIPKPR